jgi:hypothetical protein
VEGLDPTTTSWAMNGLGWFMALLPFGVLVLGYFFAIVRHKENKELIQDVIS